MNNSVGKRERTDVLGSSCTGGEEPEGGTQEAAGTVVKVEQCMQK